jgi:hypothetical protein
MRWKEIRKEVAINDGKEVKWKMKRSKVQKSGIEGRQKENVKNILCKAYRAK